MKHNEGDGVGSSEPRTCARCGADRTAHDIEPPYECVDTECDGFAYAVEQEPASTARATGRDGKSDG